MLGVLWRRVGERGGEREERGVIFARIIFEGI